MKEILVVDDHRLIFDGLKYRLEADYALRYAPSISVAKEALAGGTVMCCILDLSLNGENGLELLEEIPRDIVTFVLSMHKALNVVSTARSLGARGYFLKDESLDPLVEAIGNYWRKDFWITEALSVALESESRAPSPVDSLTKRELQIFVMLAEGLNYREIAARLNISPKTVNAHRDNIFEKTGLTSVVEIVRLSGSLGLTLQ